VSERRDRFDPELAELLSDDPELIELAQLLRDSRPEPVLDPRFEAVLRARVVREARTVLAPRPERVRRPLMGRLAWGSLALSAALATAAVAIFVGGRLLAPTPASLAVSAPIAGHGQVNPDQAITLSFNQPMNEQSVEAALKIVPATAFTVTWTNSETAVVTPEHPLAADTDYQVTVVSSAESQSGQTLATNTTFSFATKPTPAGAPILQSANLGEADSYAEAFWDASGNPGVTSSTAWQPAAGALTGPAATAGSGTKSRAKSSPGDASPSGTAPGLSPALLPEVLSFPAVGTPVTLSRSAATAVAFSTGPGHNLALAIPQANGTSVITVAAADGSAPTAIWPSAGTPGAPVTALAWSGDNAIVFVTPAGIESVDVTSFQVTTLFALTATGSANGVVLAPDGADAYVPAADIPGLTASPTSPASPAATGTASTATATATPTPTATATPGGASENGYLVDLMDTAATPTLLPGSAGDVVAFSGDSSLVAWVSAAGDGVPQSVLEVPTSAPSATPVSIPDPPSQAVAGLFLSIDGGEIAYSLGQDGLEVAATGDGTILGTSSDIPGSLAFSPDSTRIAYVAGGSLWVATIAAPAGTPAVAECPGAEQVLTQFVSAQVAGDDAALTALSAPGVDSTVDTPIGLSRGYAVSAGCDPDTATLTASARLIVDPSGGAAGEVTDETITLAQVGTSWQVTQLSTPPLHAEGAGPKVLQVAVILSPAGGANPETTVLVTFDSDLLPGSITSASLMLEDASGQLLQQIGPPTYDANTRTVTLTIAGTLPDGAVIVVGMSVSDIDGGHPPAPFTAPVGG
jgi:hypothetical protein